MQTKNWNDLRYLLAVKRGRSIAGAARLMGVDGTTVSRRLSALQSATGEPLFTRRGDGSTVLTTKGEEIVSRIEAMERESDLIWEAMGSGQHSCAGSVRLTSVPIVINRILAPVAGDLLAEHPDLQIELVPESRDLSLTLREADLAIRLARPVVGGDKVKARRVGQLDYAVYAARGCPLGETSELPWITYEDAMAHVRQAQWMRRVVRSTGQEMSGLRVHDGETALEAVAAGLGRSLLPTIVADRHDGLRRLRDGSGVPLPSRELWLLVHADQVMLRRIKTVISWIENALQAHGRNAAGSPPAAVLGECGLTATNAARPQIPSSVPR